MKRLMNILRGMLMLRITGPFPERFVNLCAQMGVEFWGVEWLDEHTIRLTARRTFKNQLLHLAQRAGCQVEVEGRYGLPDFLLRFRSRYAFLLGLLLAVVAIKTDSILSTIILHMVFNASGVLLSMLTMELPVAVYIIATVLGALASGGAAYLLLKKDSKENKTAEMITE